jgi:glycosyltransferase involved in cell wall biosynthesis
MLTAWFAGARVISGRVEWVESEQRWTKRLHPDIFIWALIRQLLTIFPGKRKPLYRIRPLRPIVQGRRPRVVFALPNVFVGGSTQLVVDLCNHLGHAYEMQVITAAFPKNSRHEGMVAHHHPLPGNTAAMTKTLETLKPNLLHVHYWGDVDKPWYDALFAAAERVGCPVVQNINTPVAPFSCRAIVANVFVSDTIRRAFSSPGSGKVIHPGIDLKLFSPPSQFEPGAIDTLGMVYRLEPDKLNPSSIQPLIDVVRKRPRTRVIVVGGGTFFDTYVAQTKKAGVADNFVFTGYVPYESLPSWYAHFRTFIAPVWQESFGQVTPFAMAMGLAVAGTHIGALPEILEGTETLGATNDVLTNKVVDLLDHPERIEALGVRNREIALRRFGLEHMVAAYDEVYREVLGKVINLELSGC